MLTIGIILQARMGSTRLPGKVLRQIGSRNLLEHIFYRLTFLRHPVKTILATTSHPQDNVLETFCQKQNIACFRGSRGNVLERYYLCAQEFDLQNIIRLTGDNPFTDIEELDNLIDLHLGTGVEYSHSFDSLPIGAGAEIFTFAALDRCYRHGVKDNHREHVNEYIQENPQLFEIAVLSTPPGKNHPRLRLTVDTDEDLQRACYIVENSPQSYVTTEEAIRLCSQYV